MSDHASFLPAHCGEVIAADTVQFEAECPQLYGAPDFGSFVRAEADGRRVYAVVCYIATGCIDTNRRIQAHHLPPDEIEQRMPQLPLVLRTTFTARVVGFRHQGQVRPYLPPQPLRIHSFVYRAAPDEVRALTQSDSPTFLRTLADATEVPVEDLIAAALRHAAAAWEGRPQHHELMVAWGKYLARLFKSEYDRYEAIMHRWLGQPLDSGAPWEAPLPVASDQSDPFA